MKDFKDYKEEEVISAGKSPDVMKTFRELASKYEGKSGDEMMNAIIEEAEKNRKNGKLTDKDIDDFVATISPMLSAKQKLMLKAVVAKIKKD